MRIVVLSDTHISSMDSLPKEVIDEVESADLVIHAGDYTGKRFVEELISSKKFKGVHGNMDAAGVKGMLPSVEVFTIGRYTIGICHPSEGGPPFNIEKRIMKRFKKAGVIIYGHTHFAKCETIEGRLFLNPGSATGAWPAVKRTYGILEMDDEVRVRIVEL